jgi:hypothetical protein
MLKINTSSKGDLKMRDILDVIENINTIYNNNSSLAILKDFERVFDELDMYVFENWRDGELIEGPVVDRHWVTASFMWPKMQMPNPQAAKRLIEYGCGVKYKRDVIVKPRQIKEPDDIRPGTKLGKLDEQEIWVVEVSMPKKLMLEIFRGYHNQVMSELDPANDQRAPELATPPAGEATAGAPPAAAAAPVPGGEASAAPAA